ncbi:MAG: TrkH family potassium uptake protein [Nitrosomonadales bacterium]|jgi:trk system potassium uptake protein TrkH|nr:MAG: TrkH family potassium uptake protein [Nitrosomonadales bacterium]
MSRLFAVLNVLGIVILIFGFTMLLPLALSIWLDNVVQFVYYKSAAITITSGLMMWVVTRSYKRELKARDGFLLVVLVWSVLPVFATLPLLFHLPYLGFTKAYFEATSGLTATGGTVLTGIDLLPPSINLWRTEMIWMGGMGLIVLAVAILPLLGVGGRQMFKAETPGPMKDTKLTPRIAETAKGLWLVYTGITIACAFSYKLAGMTWLDAVMHAFTTIGLGGFSSHDASFAYWDSPQIEGVAIVFMLIAGINFATHFLAWREKALLPYRYDPEAGLFIAIILISCLMLTIYLWNMGVYPDLLTALRYASFNTVSVATTTGYSNADYNLWPIFAPLWMLTLCCFCSSSGSTGGGIKMIRAQLLFKQVFREMIVIMHPQAVLPIKVSNNVVSNKIIYAILAFLSIYLASIVSLTLILAFSGLDFITSFSTVVACINNLGPGLNQVGPATTFAGLTNFQTWICSFSMLLGRLELFTLLVVFVPAFWRK